MTTDALVSELRDTHAKWLSSGYPEGCGVLFKQAADTIERLTRELAEAGEERDVYAKQAGELAAVATDHGIRMEQAEAERDTWEKECVRVARKELLEAIAALRPGGCESAILADFIQSRIDGGFYATADVANYQRIRDILRAPVAVTVMDEMIDRAIDGYYKPPAFNWRGRPELAIKMRERFRRALQAALAGEVG